MLIADILSFYGKLSAKIACIWLSVWVVRRSTGVDYSLDRSAKAVRWAIVAIGLAIGYVPGPNFGYVRLGGFLLGLAFLCWPNFAYHLTALFKRKPSQSGVG